MRSWQRLRHKWIDVLAIGASEDWFLLMPCADSVGASVFGGLTKVPPKESLPANTVPFALAMPASSLHNLLIELYFF
jgi:hypothetical protein